MTKAELNELREAWARAVLFDGPWIEALPIHPRGSWCWFDEDLGLIPEGEAGPCEGRIEGAHWIKRQTVEEWVWRQLPSYDMLISPTASLELKRDLKHLAAWDPRNGIPACERHHRIFDSQRVPLPSEQIVVWRHQVPAHVEAFALDWGLDFELERKHPVIGEGI